MSWWKSHPTSRAKLLEHEQTHAPFWSWCKRFVRGRGQEAPHTMVVEESQLHGFHMDFAFLGGEDYPGMSVPTLVVRKRSTKMVIQVNGLSRRSTSGRIHAGGWV